MESQGLGNTHTVCMSNPLFIQYIHSHISYIAITRMCIIYIISGWWFQTFFMFHNIWDVILPIDELIFSRWLKPPTRYGWGDVRSIYKLCQNDAEKLNTWKWWRKHHRTNHDIYNTYIGSMMISISLHI